MDDTEFLQALRDYIEEAEVSMENEQGTGRTLEKMIAAGHMPDVYAEVLRRLEACQVKKSGG
jgi:hypothetical protein